MANTDQIDKIITIRFRYSELMEGIAQIDKATGEIKSEMAAFKADMKDFNRQVKSGAITQAEYNQRMADYGNRLREDEQLLKALSDQRHQYTREVQANIKEEAALDGSVNKLRASIARLTAQYNNLSRAERNAAKGTAMRDEIKAMQVELNAANEGLLNFRDSVGNYGLAAKGFSPLTYQVQQLAREMPSLTVSAQQFFLAISNNLPMMADEVTRAAKANKALRAEGKQTVPVLMQLVKSIFSWQTLLVVAITLITAFGKEIAAWVKGLFSGNSAVEEISASINMMNQSVDRGVMELRNEFDALKNAEKGTAQYAAAKKVIQDKYGSYLENQRDEIRNLEDMAAAYELLRKNVIATTAAKGLEEANAKALEKYAEETEKAFQEIQKKFIEKWGEEQGVEDFTRFRVGLNSKIPELEAEARRIYEMFNSKIEVMAAGGGVAKDIDGNTIYVVKNTLQSQVEDINDAYARLDSVLDSNQIAMKTLLEMTGKQEEAVTDLVKAKQAEIELARKMPGSTEEEVAARNRRIEALEAELTALQNLGKTAKETVNSTTKSTADEAVKYAQKAADEVYRLIQDLREKTRDNEILNLQEDYDREVASVRARLEEIAGLTDEISISEQKSLNQKILLLQEKLKKDITEVNKKYSKKMLDEEIKAEKEKTKRLLAERKLNVESAESNVLDVKKNNGSALEEAHAVVALRKAEAEAAFQALVDIDTADANNFASEQERDLKRLQAVNTLKEAQIELADAVQRTIDLQRENAIRAAQKAGEMLGNFSSMFDALGGESEKFAAFSKAFAVMQVALAQAVAIAQAVASGANGAPWFMLPITIASSVAAVIAAIAQATRQVGSTKVPKYALGGLVEGPGTGTSDSIPVRLSNGEAVMTAQAVADWGPILSAFNVASGGNAIAPRNLPERNDGLRGLKQIFKEAFEEMPPQYVAVTEINRVGRRVKVSENVARLGGKRGK